MTEEGQGGEVISFMAEQFRRLNVRFDAVDARFDAVDARIDRLDGRMEDRLANIERRLSAQVQTEQSIIGHLASIHSSIDNLRVDFVGMERRVRELEAR